MLILLSPAKTFSKYPIETKMKIKFQNETEYLLSKLKKISSKRFETHMHISKDMAVKVYDYYQTFGKASFMALSLFDGQAFKGLDYMSLKQEHKDFAENHLLILDALYGLIAPHDGISPYRLEMQEKMIGNLYHYWKKPIHQYLASKETLIINLASKEYSAILHNDLNMVTIDFRQKTKNQVKSISMYTKKARGMMARHLIIHQLQSQSDIKDITFDGYRFDQNLSDDHTYIFLKELE